MVCYADDSEFESTDFALMPFVLGRQGAQGAQQSLAQARCVDAVNADALDLEILICFEGLAKPAKACKGVLRQQESGAISQLTEQQLAAKIVRATSTGLEGACRLRKVTIRQLKYHDIDVYRMVTDGFVDGFPFEIEILALGPKKAHGKKDLCTEFTAKPGGSGGSTKHPSGSGASAAGSSTDLPEPAPHLRETIMGGWPWVKKTSSRRQRRHWQLCSTSYQGA